MNIKTGYKLFEMDEQGNLYPLFIDKNTIMPIGELITAGIHITRRFSARPGFHIGEIPAAPWLMSSNGTYKSQRRKNWKRVWAEVEYVADIDYTLAVQTLPGKCMKSTLPHHGFYQFRETGVNRVWIIASQMRITRVLSEDERMEVLKKMDYDEMKAFEPYKASFEKRKKTLDKNVQLAI